MEGVYISLIVFASILGCVIYYALLSRKLGDKAEKVTTGVVLAPTNLLDKASKSVSNKHLSRGLKGASRLAKGLTLGASLIPIGVGMVVVEGAAGLSRSVRRGMSRDMSHRVSQDMSRGVRRDVSQNMSQNLSETARRSELAKIRKNIKELNKEYSELADKLDNNTIDINERFIIETRLEEVHDKLVTEDRRFNEMKNSN